MALASPCPTKLFPSLHDHSQTKPTFLHPSSSSCHLFLNPRTNGIKFEIHCTSQRIQLENEEYHGKGFLRPNFYEQTRERWSVKIPSQRVKFPWQEEKTPDPSHEIQEHGFSSQGNLVLDQPVHIQSPISNSSKRVISAPWEHGAKAAYSSSDNRTGMLVNRNQDGQSSKECIVGEKTRNSEFDKEGPKSTVGLIVEKLKELEYSDDSENEELGSYRFRVSAFGKSGGSVKLPWERNSTREEEGGRSKTMLAESTVPAPELRRLRSIALKMKERTKVGAAGITQEVVDGIKEKWRNSEVVKIKFEGPPAFQMKRTHETLERKTGGLVIWRSGSSIVLYRGMTYKLPCAKLYTEKTRNNNDVVTSSVTRISDVARTVDTNASVRAIEMFYSGPDSPFGDKYEDFVNKSEINNLLDDLGPRFKDWSGCDPLPVDADLLPSVIPGYKPPFRLLPYGTRHCLGNKEMTTTRRLARKISPHFALGRNRQHQGLAAAMVKLWEKSSIAKIAIKRGVPNTRNERMAEEIKQLTGGTLVSRNKEYIVFYRGNDFLSPAVKDVLLEREKLAKVKQDEEEQARMRASASIVSNVKKASGLLIAGTLSETTEAISRWGKPPSSEEREEMMRAAALAKHASLVRYLERKLTLANEKMKKAEKALAKVQEFLIPAELPTDLETITDEERFLFRKIGLSMKSFLLLGRRGVFDGTVENMHLHWKHRELIKIIVQARNFALVKHIAISLEAESGGVLISVDRTSKGYAIIVYRGKNYLRPTALRPKNLLTKRKALARSIELQRREALKHHISDLQKQIEMLRSELVLTENTKEPCNEDMYLRLDAAFSSDKYLEDEGEEAYLETYDCGSDDEDQNTLIEEL